MRILNSCILELREHKGRRFLCRLIFEKSSDESFNTEEQRDFHWLDRSDWKTFDAQLAKSISKLEKGVLEEKSFQLNDEIDVVVSISSTAVRTVSKLLGIECLAKKDYPVSLKCLFQRQCERKTKIISANVCRDSENFQKLVSNSATNVDTSNRYCNIAEPDVNLKHLEDRDIFANYSSDDISSGEKNLVKFKNVKLKSIDKEKTKKGPSFNIKASQDDIGLQQFATQRNNHRPQRTSARREKNDQVAIGKHEESFNYYEESDDFIEEPSVKIGLKTQETLLKTKRQRSLKFDNIRCQENKSNSNWLTKKQPEELVVAKKKSKITKSKVKAPSACAIITTKDTDSQHRQNEQIKANKKIKSFLEQAIQVPKEVKILTLNNMGGDEILNTFPKYKNQLDAVFNELRSKPKVSGYNGINHFSVIELIDNEKQLKIMHKLGEVYEKDGDGISMYPMLFANALMPEWLVNIFKDKYNFSYSEAVTHLNKQRLYMQYMATDDHY